MTILAKNLFQNTEWRSNQENISLGQAGEAKKVVLFDSSGNELVIQSLGSGVVDGTTTVPTAGTAVRITAVSTPIKGVWVCADLLAGITMTVGASTVVGNASGMRGLVLTPGNPPVFIPISNLNLLYVDAQSNGGKLSWFYTT